MPCVAHKRRSGVAFFIGGDKLRLQPITRKERFLYEIVGWGETAPKNELTTEELLFAKILGRNVTLPDLSNVPRYYLFLAKIAGENVNVTPPAYVSPPLEFFLAKAAGMDVETPIPRTREEIFWAAYAGVEIEIEGVPPLTFKSNGANLSNYRIYGNTVNGESVGDLVESGEHTGEYLVPVTVTNGTDTETTNLYLPEQIKMVGDEAEYIDFKEQKQHKVRKNLIDFNWLWDYEQHVPTGIAGKFFHYIELVLNPNTTYNVSSDYPFSFDSNTTAFIVVNSETEISTNNGGVFGSRSVTTAQDGILKIARRISGGSAVIPNRSELELKEKYIQVEKGSIATEYESYIESTELDVELPALPTLSGTNTLSVETTVQPSKVMIKTGKFGTHKVRYYDSDGTFLSAEDVKDGTNAQGFTPTKASTAQYNYIFMGWSTTKGSTIAETGVLNDITADKSLYAVFSQSLRTFTVYFYNGSTLLQTAENVQYGGTATYTSETPTKDGFTFSGWQPSNVNITADTSCYVQFVEG